ncbi:MAG: hypothetical protein JST40_08235 [Armatimonadetes bacterium]|nr:hypothetical protein [Armatimonadota bacterium]
MPTDLYNPQSVKVLQKESDAFIAQYLRKPADPPTEAEVDFARTTGTWREDETIAHDEIIDRILQARKTVRQEEVADLFVLGLARKSPLHRSPIASYAISMHLKPHEPEYPHPNFPCAVCGLDRGIDGQPASHVFWRNNLLCRVNYGGAASLQFVLSDLEDLPHLPSLGSPTGHDIDALRALLDLLREQPSTSTPGKLAKAIGAQGGKNDLQRTALIETLGYMGVLEPESNPSYRTAFVRFIDRPGPDGRNDWEYPVMWWRGSDGVNENAVQHWFGHLL